MLCLVLAMGMYDVNVTMGKKKEKKKGLMLDAILRYNFLVTW